MKDIMKGPGFELFNSLSGHIEIEMTEDPQRIGKLLNLKAPPTSKLVNVTWINPSIYDSTNPSLFRSLTPEEMELVVFETPNLYLDSYPCIKKSIKIVEHQAPNGKNFTIKDMISVVEETERQTRGETNWFGGIDIHHIYFEGLECNPNIALKKVWTIHWGS